MLRLTGPAELVGGRARETPAERKARKQAVLSRRSYVPAFTPVSRSILDRTLRWLMPWDRLFYPGIERGSYQLFQQRVEVRTIRHWRRQRHRIPSWAVQLLIEHVRARCAAGLELVRELERYEAARPPHHRLGIHQVDPLTGTDRRRIASSRNSQL